MIAANWSTSQRQYFLITEILHTLYFYTEVTKPNTNPNPIE